MSCCISMRENTQMKAGRFKAKTKKGGGAKRGTTENIKSKVACLQESKMYFMKNKVTDE